MMNASNVSFYGKAPRIINKQYLEKASKLIKKGGLPPSLETAKQVSKEEALIAHKKASEAMSFAIPMFLSTKNPNAKELVIKNLTNTLK